MFRTVFLLIVILSPQFVHARGMQGNLLIIATIAAAGYNLGLFILHMEGLSFPRPIIVAVDTMLISLWIYFAGADGERYFVMYFAVVIVAGLWFRRGGAFAVALFASIMYVGAITFAPLEAGADRAGASVLSLQILFLLLTAGIVSIATEVQERERQELVLSRAALQQHWERVRIAQHVDEMLRPRHLPPTPGLAVAFRFRPAARAVSGDYYDVVPLGGRRWGIVVADVRAKEELGLIYLPLFKSALRVAARRESSPARVLTQINQEVAAEMHDRDEPEVFISMCYAILDLDEGVLACANAGIEPSVLIPRHGGELTTLSPPGIVLGVLPEAAYEEVTHPVGTGATVVFFTDGMTEVFDSEDRILGRDGLLAQIGAHADAASADAMAKGIFDYVVDYGREGRRRDDMTLLVARVTAADVGAAEESSAA